MDLSTYLQRRSEQRAQEPRHRRMCSTCFQPDFSCYCELVEPFETNVKFVILIHPIEAARRVATGRMSHLFLKNSELIRGHHFGDNRRVNELVHDSRLSCHLLYPGPRSRDLSSLSDVEKKTLFPSGRQPVLFVVDGTWSTAKKMVNQSPNLFNLPRIQFTPVQASRFRVRRQPRPQFCSTIEAIHHAIELLAPSTGFDLNSRVHDCLLRCFDQMVEQQIQLSHKRQRRRLSRPRGTA